MKNMKKKIIAIVAMTTMLGTLVIANIHATGSNTFQANLTAGGVEFPAEFTITNPEKQEVSLTKGNEDTTISGELVIPNTIQDPSNPSIEYTITEIGQRAFEYCAQLTSTGLASNQSVTVIGNDAFSGCRSLISTGLENNNTVTTIGSMAFGYCTTLTSTGFEKNQTITVMKDHIFQGCTNLLTTGLETNNTVTTIEASAFWGCTGLRSTGLESNQSVTTIGICAFKNCSGLTSLRLEGNYALTTIEESAFEDCDGVTSMTFSKGIKNIGRNLLGSSDSQLQVIFRGDIPIIDENAFSANSCIYYREGMNIDNLNDSIGTTHKNPYTMTLDVSDSGTGYHAGNQYSNKNVNVKIQYIDSSTQQPILSDVYASPYEIQNCLVLSEEYKLQAGENTIHAEYDGIPVNYKVNASDHDIRDWETDKEPTTTSEGLRVRRCEICGETVESQVIDRLYTYSVLESEENYTKGTKKDITYKIDGDYSLFTGIKMDGNDIDKENYTSKQGSTIIAFKSAYLESLSEGNHEITVMFHGHEVKISLAVQSDPNQTSNKTDDGTSETKPDIPADIVPNTPVLNDNESTTNQTNDSPAKNENVVSTSDETSMLAYMGILMLSGVMGGLAFKKRKEI